MRSIVPDSLARGGTAAGVRSNAALAVEDENSYWAKRGGPTPDDVEWVPTRFTENRDRLLDGNMAEGSSIRCSRSRMTIGHSARTR